MIEHDPAKAHRRIRDAKLKTHRRRQIVGMGSAVGAFLAFGAAPLAVSPTAYADDFGLSDLIGNPLGDAGDETAGAGGVVGDSGHAAIQATLDSAASDSVVQQVQTVLEDWINSPVGQVVDGLINQFAPKGEIFIGNGADGTAAADPNGQNVLWLGDGGNGWSSTQDGVAGGDGGNGGALIGNGGDGGNAGDGATAAGLPALGGAGGTAGLLGSHGAVGHFGTLADGTPSGSAATIETTGNWLTNSDGQAVILNGMNETYKTAPFEPSASGFGADDAAFLAANGFNAVQLGIMWAAVEPEPGVFNDAYLSSIAQTVQTLADHGIVTILDMHQDLYSSVFGSGDGAPAWATETGGLPNVFLLPSPLGTFFNPAENHAWDALWTNADAPNGVGLASNFAQMWEHIANYFSGNPDVLFSIFSEPYPGTQGLGTHFGTEVLTPFYNQVASAIRAVDPTTPILFEPNVLAQNGAVPINLGTLDDPHAILSFGTFATSQSEIDKAMQDVVKYADSHDIPALLTSFGATDDQTTLTTMIGSANQHRLGWLEWAYTGVGDTTTSAQSANAEALVLNPNEPPTGANVNTATLATLAQPYPQVVSGTPGSWSFDNGTFAFSYTTDKVDGLGSFAAGSQTTISTPVVEFPNGYHVSVTGGHVVSAPNAAELVIASNNGASTVTVTVTGGTASGAG